MGRPTSPTAMSNVSLLVILSIVWGSAFILVKIAVTTVPPLSLAWTRIVVGGLTLYGMARWRGLGFPRGDGRFWAAAAATGLTGMALPFSLIAWGMPETDSGIAAILTATVPLWTMLLAHLFLPDEALTRRGLVGIVLGFIGVLLLFADKTQAGSKIFSAALILMASLSYGFMAILIKRTAAADTLQFSAAVAWCGAAFLTPLILVVDRPWTLAPDTAAVFSMLALGVLHTGIATVWLVKFIGQAGATYASMTNYTAPIAAIILGTAFLGEHLPASAGAGFLLIVLGIYLTGQMGQLGVGNRADRS